MQARATTNGNRGNFRIVEFTNPSGAIAYRVTGWTVDGKRIRENLKTHAEAAARLQQLEIEAANLTDAARPVVTRLTPEQAQEAELAFAELNGKPLLPAVRYYLKNYREPIRQITVADAFKQFLEDKARQNVRPDTITNLRRKCALLMTRHGAVNVSEVLPDHVKEIVFRPGLSPVSSDNVRRALGGFFNWTVDHEFIETSPLAKIKAVKTERDEPEILTLAECRALLSAAADYKQGVCLPFVAISLFAAVRAKELARIGWQDVNLDGKTITITGKAAKLRERRIVDLSDNLVEWLRPHALARRPFIGPNWRRDFDAVKAQAGFGGRTKKAKEGEEEKPVKEWTPDIMRHTAISMHLAKHQHEGQTAMWAGNSPDIIQRHYRGLVQNGDAESFWKIAPDTKPAAKLRKNRKAQAA